MGHKTTEIICNINKAFGPWTANECTVQGWFKKLCKGGESLKDEEHSHWPSKIDTDQLRAVIEAGLLATTQEAAQELNVDHSMDIWHLKERWKNLISGCLMSWLKIKKKNIVWMCCLLLFYETTTNHFLINLWHGTKSGLYMTTGSVVGLRRSSKALYKAKLAAKRGHGHCLVACCPSDPL